MKQNLDLQAHKQKLAALRKKIADEAEAKMLEELEDIELQTVVKDVMQGARAPTAVRAATASICQRAQLPLLERRRRLQMISPTRRASAPLPMAARSRLSRPSAALRHGTPPSCRGTAAPPTT